MDNPSIQTTNPPLCSLDSANNYYKTINQICFNKLGIFSDELAKNLIHILIEDEQVKAIFRISLDSSELLSFYKNVTDNFNLPILLRFRQGHTFTVNDITNIERISSLWSESHGQEKPFNESNIQKLIDVDLTSVTKGRGEDIKINTMRTVWFEAKARCMFEGCGQRLDYDNISGQVANFSYLAHNVASSENGPRGLPLLSGEDSNNPKNILLLCDIHHRLVDKVATCDYPAHRLTVMRENHVKQANICLNQLSYTPIYCYSLLWSVAGNHFDEPSTKMIADCLTASKNVMKESIMRLTEGVSDSTHHQEDFLKNLSKYIQSILYRLSAQVTKNQVAFFATGPSFALIALGAGLGNKMGLIPMLRFRNGATWKWVREQPLENPFYINEPESYSNEVILKIELTDRNVSGIENTIAALQKTKKMEVIEVIAAEHGNGSIGHPAEGLKLSLDIKNLLVDLQKKGVQKVHLLSCASNAANVFIGQGIDKYQPEVVVYDFVDKVMVPKVTLYYSEEAFILNSAPDLI